MDIHHLQLDFARLMREVDQTQDRGDAIALIHQASKLAEHIGELSGDYPDHADDEQKLQNA